MKYIITGSIGHISKPVASTLANAGHEVVVISSHEKNKDAIKALGATPAIGSIEDMKFVQTTFKGADAVYLMIPQNFAAADFYKYQQQVADNYIAAIRDNNIKYVVQLSSIGAHLRKDSGPIDGLAYLEEQLEKLPDTNVLFLRPSYFFYNLYSQMDMVKNAGIFGANFGGKLVLTDTKDIASIAAEALLLLQFKGHTIQYIASDERTTDEIATVLGSAIGKSGTPWVVFSDEQSQDGMLKAGIPPGLAKSYTQMGHSINNGSIQEDYWKHKPQLGHSKLEDFAKEFAIAFAK